MSIATTPSHPPWFYVARNTHYRHIAIHEKEIQVESHHECMNPPARLEVQPTAHAQRSPPQKAKQTLKEPGTAQKFRDDNIPSILHNNNFHLSNNPIITPMPVKEKSMTDLEA